MKIGDKVICVENLDCLFCGAKIFQNNNVYVVSAIKTSLNSKCGFAVRILGVEHDCGTGFSRGDRFRLLAELKEQNANKQQQAQVA